MYDLFATEAVKRCSMCRRRLPLYRFAASRKAADGLQAYCRDCQAYYRRQHPGKEYKYNHTVPGRDLFDNEA